MESEDTSVFSAIKEFGSGVGKYWSRNNANFERTKPNFGNRALRSLNPYTGVGSAWGAIYDAHKGNSNRDMAIALAQLTPVLGVGGKAIALGKGPINKFINTGINKKKTLGTATGVTTASVSADTAQALENRTEEGVSETIRDSNNDKASFLRHQFRVRDRSDRLIEQMQLRDRG